MYQITVLKQCDNVRGVAQNDEPAENYHLTLQLPYPLRRFIASLAHCLAVQPTTLLLCFTLTVLIQSLSPTAGISFQRKTSKNPLRSTCSVPNSRQTQLAD